MVKIGCLFAVTKCNFLKWTVFAEPIYREPQTSFNMHWMIRFNHIFFRRGGSCGRDYLGTRVVLENYIWLLIEYELIQTAIMHRGEEEVICKVLTILFVQ